MAWFSGNISLGNIADLAGGAVNKLQESVKSIEKNFDSALGYDEKEKADSSGNEASGLWSSSTDRKALFNPVMAFMGHRSTESDAESSQKPESVGSPEVEKPSGEQESPQHPSMSEEKEGVHTDKPPMAALEEAGVKEEREVVTAETSDEHQEMVDGINAVMSDPEKVETVSSLVPAEPPEAAVQNFELSDSVENQEREEMLGVEALRKLESVQEKSGAPKVDQVEGTDVVPKETDNFTNVHENMHEQKDEVESTDEQKTQVESTEEQKTQVESTDEQKTQVESPDEQKAQVESSEEQKTHVESTDEQKAQAESVEISPVQTGGLTDTKTGSGGTAEPSGLTENGSAGQTFNDELPSAVPSDEASETVPEQVSTKNNIVVGVDQHVDDKQSYVSEQHLRSRISASGASDSAVELERVKKEMKMLENALQGAARQAQAKADEIAKLMNENEQLKLVIEDLKRKTSDVEIETLREEYHQRVATLERKVYALTKERDTLRREQSKKSDAAALLKEKDEIINQVMAEGEELSKKQAAQEGQIRKLRAQIRELEEEKKGLVTKLQVEENKVESIKRDKTATEKLLQETIERHQSELALQKEFYTNALNAAKEAEALAEARANNEARSELESRLREAEERESMLVQALEDLRQTLSRKEQQAVFREDMLRRDIEDLQKRYQASERRCEELITQVPESTRPLLRQIEAMQETTARRAEAWAAVERSLNSRFQEAEAKAAAAEERERSVNERLSQTLSRINVLEAQISCLRAEQTQLSKSLEKERKRAAENRQEYHVAKEEADTQEGRANQLEEEIRELKRKHKQELHEALTHRELLQQEIEKEKAARLDLERTARVHSVVHSVVPDQTPIRQNSVFENGNLSRRPSSASSLGSMEESYYLQASLDSSDGLSERKNAGEVTLNPYYMKSMTPGAFESALRQKEGELASYMSRLASMESIRDSLAEELVKMTEQCEKLRAEASTLPGIRAELESLRRRHSAALELMGERDEELEELRADIIDLKEMYREQINLLVNKIQILSSSIGNS
ncbi:golgin candidate 5 [Morus notabilis]|uniref:golgin candidate 5 n=1 Tax=Morus notabilis TaxID=981085 RepID=UPI000CED77C3|nr:golgin candidate 5 [Morus notabilis]XP_024022476.1 golgin candidate 5 [Morus notabilis]